MHHATRLTSLLPRPNPLITGPDKRMGYGASGPSSGPATVSRGLSMGIAMAKGVVFKMVVSFFWAFGRVVVIGGFVSKC